MLDHAMGRLMAILTNIGLAWNILSNKNALAYFQRESVMKKVYVTR